MKPPGESEKEQNQLRYSDSYDEIPTKRYGVFILPDGRVLLPAWPLDGPFLVPLLGKS